MSGVNFTSHKDEFISQYDASLAKAWEEIGLQAEANAKLYSPVDTGRLRNSISHDTDGKEVAVIGTNVEYAPYQEFGTSKMKAANDGRGFLRPSIEDNLSQYREIMETNLSSLNT